MSQLAVSLLDLDPDLGRGLEPARFEAARRDGRVAVVDFKPGPWFPEDVAPGSQATLGLLVIHGAIVRRIGERRRGGAELLGAQDLIQPWPLDSELAAMTTPPATWRVLEPTQVAILDAGLAARIAAFPEIMSHLLSRAIERSRGLLVQLSVAHHARIDERLDFALWHLAQRWGRVTPDGVALTVRLTHELLADLVAAQRPSVTLSLQHLERDGRIARRDNIIYLLGDPPAAGSASTDHALTGPAAA